MPQKNEERLQKYLAECGVASRRKSVGGLKKKRSERGDVIFLTEADFKD